MPDDPKDHEDLHLLEEEEEDAAPAVQGLF